MNDLLNIAHFCFQSEQNKNFAKTDFYEKKLFFIDNITTKNFFSKQEIITTTLKKIKQHPNSNFIICQLCENNIKISGWILDTFNSPNITNLYFGIFSEELFSPIIITPDNYGIKYIVKNICYGNPKIFQEDIQIYHQIVCNLFYNYSILTNKSIVQSNLLNIFDRIINVFVNLNCEENLLTIHETFPYLFVSLFIDKFSNKMWGRLIKFFIENNMWKILDNINTTFKKNNLDNINNFYSFITKNLIQKEKSSFSFFSENTITIEINGIDVNYLNIIQDMKNTFPNNKNLSQFIQFHSNTIFNIKVSGLNQYYNVPKFFTRLRPKTPQK